MFVPLSLVQRFSPSWTLAAGAYNVRHFTYNRITVTFLARLDQMAVAVSKGTDATRFEKEQALFFLGNTLPSRTLTFYLVTFCTPCSSDAPSSECQGIRYL
jgi:hypothetical protein